MKFPFDLEAALHEQSPFDLGLFPLHLSWSTPKKAEFSNWANCIGISTVSPRFVVGTNTGETILCDTSYDDCIFVSYYANDCYNQWCRLLERKAGSIPCDSSIKAHYDENACDTFDQALFAWIKNGCKPDYDFRFRL